MRWPCTSAGRARREVVVNARRDRVEAQDRRDQDDAVQRDAALVQQVVGQGGGTRGSVALAGEEFRGEPALISRDVEADEIGDGADVLLDAEKLFGLFAGGGPAVAGVDRIDEHQVGGGKPGVGVLHQRERRRRGIAVLIERDAHGAGGAQVQPDGGGAGAAIEDEGDRALARRAWRGRLLVIGDEEHLRLRLPVLAADQELTCPGLVLQRLPVHNDLMVGRGDLIRRLARLGGAPIGRGGGGRRARHG